MKLKKKITKPYQYKFNLSKSGLVVIFVSARCKSKRQIKSNTDEDLRIEVNNSRFREILPEKNTQLFNIQPTFNGSKLKGLKKIVIVLTVLKKGENVINLIPRKSSFIEEINIKTLAGVQNIELELREQSEDSNRRPWITIVLVDLPLKSLAASITAKWRPRDSDDVKLVIDNKIQINKFSILHRNWLWSGSIFMKLLQRETQAKTIKPNLSQGLHYLEFWADKMPFLHKIRLDLRHAETVAEIRASNLIKNYASAIKQAAVEFKVDPIIVGAVIYQEQSTNVNFIDTLTDYIGGIFHLNTSIGIGQVRVKTAKDLEKYYLKLDYNRSSSLFVNDNFARVERLKDPLNNIRYVAAKINFNQERWKKAGFDLSDSPDILGTLYNIEDIVRPVKPHSKPRPNKFGRGVKINYQKVKKLLNL